MRSIFNNNFVRELLLHQLGEGAARLAIAQDLRARKHADVLEVVRGLR